MSSTTPLLVKSALLAFCVEAAFFVVIGTWNSSSSSLRSSHLKNETQFLETEVFQLPPQAHQLVEEKKVAPPVEKPEKAISQTPGHGTQAPPGSQNLEEENKTTSGPRLAPTHGPIAVISPSPVIPPYLQDKEIKTHVIIDFFINQQGIATPRLVGSSGNEELDAIALATLKQWVFRPAEKEGKPIDSKIRLRIVFTVQ
jgi:TonB family protein